MTALRATFYFPVDRLCIAPELLGTTHELDVDGRRVRLTFPTEEVTRRSEDDGPDPSIFPGPDPTPFPLIEGGGEVFSSGAVLSSPGLARVDWIRTEVLFDGDVDIDSYSQPEIDAHLLASLASESALKTAKRVVAGLTAWVRVAPGQHWLGLSGEESWPKGRSRLEDLDASLRLPYSFGGLKMVIQPIDDRQILRPGMLRSVLSRVAVGDEPTLADSVLADAAWFHSHPRDTPRVVLTAAIACELKVKYVLRAKAKPEAAELLDVLLERPRDFSIAAAALFDRPMKAIAGRSLREDDPGLWKQVVRLFEIRNDVAHRGHVPTQHEALDGLRAAAGAFRWLDGS